MPTTSRAPAFSCQREIQLESRRQRGDLQFVDVQMLAAQHRNLVQPDQRSLCPFIQHLLVPPPVEVQEGCHDLGMHSVEIVAVHRAPP